MVLIINILLFIAAIALTGVLFIPSIIHAIVDMIRYGSFYRRATYYFLNTALAIDIMCNTAFSSMLNGWCLKKGGYHFGKRGETVSSALGKNQCINGLTYFGKGLAGMLDTLQKNHCYISIDDDVYFDVYLSPPNRATFLNRLLVVTGILLYIRILVWIYQTLITIL